MYAPVRSFIEKYIYYLYVYSQSIYRINSKLNVLPGKDALTIKNIFPMEVLHEGFGQLIVEYLVYLGAQGHYLVVRDY